MIITDKINKIFDNLSGFNVSENDKNNIKKTGNNPTYGELVPETIKYIIKDINKIHKNKKVVFYDLGSGSSKSLLTFGLMKKFKKLYGVELSKERHKMAKKALNNYKKMFDSKLNNVSLLNEDIFNIDINDGDVFFISNLCFGKENNKLLSNFLDTHCKKGATIYCSAPLSLYRGKENLNKEVKMTWANKSLLRRYDIIY
jgi:hypothetical protein